MLRYNPSYEECLSSLANGQSVGVESVWDENFEIYESLSEFLETYPDEKEYFEEERQVVIYST